MPSLQPSAPRPPSGCFDGLRHLYAVRVYFEDTDLSGVVYHANHLRWFERARSDMLRLLGIDQRGAQEAGAGAFAVTDLAIRYLRPARLDDDVLIASTVGEVTRVTCCLLQQARRGDDLLAEAQVRVAFVSPQGRARRLPASFHSAFSALLALTPEGSVCP